MTNSVKQALVETIENNTVVDKHLCKPGLDTEEGRFRIQGTLTLGKVFKRKNVGTNLALSAGYIVEDLQTGDTLIVEKQQGVRLCAVFGMTNAFITTRYVSVKDENGEVIQTRPSIYLQPYPQRSESFTQDERVRTAFKLDEEGNLIRPFELNVKEEECTEEVWRIIQKHYEKGSKVSNRTKVGKERQHQEKLASIRSALKSHDLIYNPFSNGGN